MNRGGALPDQDVVAAENPAREMAGMLRDLVESEELEVTAVQRAYAAGAVAALDALSALNAETTPPRVEEGP